MHPYIVTQQWTDGHSRGKYPQTKNIRLKELGQAVNDNARFLVKENSTTVNTVLLSRIQLPPFL